MSVYTQRYQSVLGYTHGRNRGDESMKMELMRLFSSVLFGVIFTVGGIVFLVGVGLPMQLQHDFTVKFVGILWLALGIFRLGTFYFRFRAYHRQSRDEGYQKHHRLLLCIGLLTPWQMLWLLSVAHICSQNRWTLAVM